MEELVFGRRYRVTEKIGSGGMAEVYQAVDEVLGRTVAVKVLHPRYATDPGFVARFRQEAQAAANLSHPTIVNIYDWGRDDETYFIVMEFVRGTDLKALVEQHGRIDPIKAAGYAAQVCAALGVAHGYDIIHRDIKPHNIVRTPDGAIKVMDFGIARAGNSTMTQTGSVMGTAHYVSPEQAQGRTLGPASDLYSLGVTLYEMVTGRVPFDADTPVAVALKQVNEAPVPPRQINPDIPEALERVIMRALHKDPAERYASAEEMRTDLKRVIAGGTVDAHPVASPDQTSVMPAVAGGGAAGAPRIRPVPRSRSPWPWIVGVLLVALAGLGIAFAMGAFDFTSTVVVPDLVGLTLDEAADELASVELTVGPTQERYSDEHPAGQIIDHSPEAGIEVPVGSEVMLTISLGIKQVEVPQLVGMAESDALRVVRDADFEIEIQREFNREIADGEVFGQTPEPGTMVAPGAIITITVSRGTQLVRVPDVAGQSRDQAVTALEAEGFKVNVTEEFSDTVAVGRIVSQSPESGVSIDHGSTVTIRLSKGPDTVEVPDVIELTETQARAAIREADLQVEVVYQEDPRDGIVLTQSPIPNATAQRGATVRIWVGKAPPDSPDP